MIDDDLVGYATDTLKPAVRDSEDAAYDADAAVERIVSWQTMQELADARGEALAQELAEARERKEQAKREKAEEVVAV